ncbi:MAG: hypothetical protein ACI4XW_13950 [Candidatus Spyradocola sp.]
MVQFKSRIIKRCDLDTLEIPAEYTELRLPETAVPEALERFRRSMQYIQPVAGPVESGDFVRLTRERESRTVNTASNAETDAGCCVGHMPGEAVELEDGRRWTIDAVKRRMLPELDDALVSRAGLPGIESVAELAASLRGELLAEEKQYMLEELVYRLCFRLVDACEYELEPDEVMEIQNRQREELSRLADETGMPILDFLAQVMPEMLGSEEAVTDPEAAYRAIAENMLKTILLGSSRVHELGGEFTEKAYRAHIRRRAAEEREPEAETEARITVTEYLYEKSQTLIDAMIRSWVKDNVTIQIPEE